MEPPADARSTLGVTYTVRVLAPKDHRYEFFDNGIRSKYVLVIR